MKPEKLNDIKKELASKSVSELTDLCIRLAKYKKENKELLNYLLYDANDAMEYASQVKSYIEEDFNNLSSHYYTASKSLRKILRLINKHAKYTATKAIELELLLWFCHKFLKTGHIHTSYKPIHAIIARQFEKIKLMIPKLHEDLAFDYKSEFDILLNEADEKLGWFQKSYYAIH